MPGVTAKQVDTFLSTVEYPADREKLLAHAKQRRTALAFREILEQLPDEQFAAPANARSALTRIDPSLARAPEPEADDGAATSTPSPLVQPLREAAETARVQGGRLVGQASETLTTQAQEQKTRLTGVLSGAIETIRESGQSADQRGAQPVAQAADFAAEKLESVSRYLEQTDVRQLARQVQDVARQQPWVVLGIGVAIGLIATRFVRSARLEQLTATSSSAGGSTSRAGSSSPTDAIALLESEHRQMRQLLQRGADAEVLRRSQMLGEIKQMLQAHERMEEEVFYPALRDNPATRELVLEAFAEHEVVDEILGEIEQTDVTDERWKPRFAAMKENLEHHVIEEESRLLPLASKAFTRGELAELGRRMHEIKQVSAERQPA